MADLKDMPMIHGLMASDAKEAKAARTAAAVIPARHGD